MSMINPKCDTLLSESNDIGLGCIFILNNFSFEIVQEHFLFKIIECIEQYKGIF